MSAATEGPARVQVIELWTGGDADLLRQSLRMTNESFAEYLGVAVRTVACWRKQPEIIPRPAIQETLDAALERAPDRNTGSAFPRSCRSVSGSGDSPSAAPG